MVLLNRRRQSERTLAGAVEANLLRALLDASPDGIAALRAVRDDGGRIVDAIFLIANRRASDLSGVPLDQVINSRLLVLFPALVQTGVWNRYLRVMDERVTETFEVVLPARNVERWLRITAAPFGDGFLITYTEITEFKRLLDEASTARQDLALEIEARQILEGELRRMSTMDGLTGVLNRRGFEETSRRAARQARKTGSALSVISFDIDHFKRVNDRFGHAAGDAVLMSVASSVVGEMRKDTDSFSRVGGEEFVLLLPNTSIESAFQFGEHLRSVIAKTPIAVEEGVITITASFGVHTLLPGCEVERLMIEADAAMYESKHSGRNRVTIFADR